MEDMEEVWESRCVRLPWDGWIHAAPLLHFVHDHVRKIHDRKENCHRSVKDDEVGMALVHASHLVGLAKALFHIVA